MTWNMWIRKIHRWISIAFTAAVVVNFVASAQKHETLLIGLLALVPLAFLLITGLYLFVLPHAVSWRAGRRAP
jgi:hypothetical protein